MGPDGPARQLQSAGSTTCCRPSLGRGPPSHRCAHDAPPWRTARAPACRHEAAARSRLTAIESSFPGCARQPPATHGVQPDVRLRCGREAQASGSSSTWVVDGTTWSGTASTARMVPKDSSRSGRRWAANLPAHQRCRRMDSTSHDGGPSHRRAQQLQRWPMQFVMSSSMVTAHEWAASAELVQPWSVRGSPRSDIAYERFVAVSTLPLMEPPSAGGRRCGVWCASVRADTRG